MAASDGAEGPAGGTLVSVVGPSGAGKDTLIARGRLALVGDPRFVFLGRTVTRRATAAAEPHDSLDPAAFAEAERAGAFALVWRAHGFAYGLPVALKAHLASGRVVVANLSRAALAEANALCRRHVVVGVTASPATLARRLAARGREAPDDIARRLARGSAEALPAGALTIRNDGALDEAVEAFVSILRAQADA